MNGNKEIKVKAIDKHCERKKERNDWRKDDDEVQQIERKEQKNDWTKQDKKWLKEKKRKK